jgi:hypothetical protein
MAQAFYRRELNDQFSNSAAGFGFRIKNFGALGNFRIVICSNFNGEATMVGEAGTVEAATKVSR